MRMIVQELWYLSPQIILGILWPFFCIGYIGDDAIMACLITHNQK
jgi:hypothetical protein